EQTISQPYIVALMTQLARPAQGDRVLEVGTGSGYQAAVLGELAAEVYSIEIVAPLAERSTQVLGELGYDNVHVRSGDGYAGWPEQAPFDAIVVTAAPERIPPPLLEQLAPGGRLVIPVGPMHSTQQLRVVEKDARGRLHERSVSPVRFVPLTGEAADRDRGGEWAGSFLLLPRAPPRPAPAGRGGSKARGRRAPPPACRGGLRRGQPAAA